MKLTDLDPQFLKTNDDGSRHMHVDSIEKADGIMFLCPKCFKENGGPVGTHRVLCWQPHVPQKIPPTPGRWTFKGTGYNDLTLVAGSSSIYLTGRGCGAHFFIRNGSIS